MRIAFLINTKAGVSKMETGFAWLRHLAQAEPANQFLLLTDNKALPSFPANVLVEQLPSLGSFFAIKARWSLGKKIKSWSPTTLVTLSDTFTIETNCPQVVIFSDTDSNFNSAQLRSLRKKANLATTTVFPSLAAAAHWQSLLKLKAANMQVISPLPLLMGKPLNNAEKMQCQLEYTEGRQFFMLNEQLTREEQLINLLKAFSLFKKRQQTNMKLVLPFSLHEDFSSFTDKFSSYKYREDVITGTLSEAIRTRLAAASYALLIVDPTGHTETCITEALQLEQPFLAPRTPGAEEVAGNSALYTEPGNFQDLADKMMLIYKDESLRAQLIQQGKEQYALLSKNAPLQKCRALLHSFAS